MFVTKDRATFIQKDQGSIRITLAFVPSRSSRRRFRSHSFTLYGSNDIEALETLIREAVKETH